jgi:hypothetical protein
MQVVLLGDHTAPYHDFPYERGRELEDALRTRWAAIKSFHFSSIDTAEVSVAYAEVAGMTVAEVYAKLEEVVKAAAQQVDWDIWEISER